MLTTVSVLRENFKKLQVTHEEKECVFSHKNTKKQIQRNSDQHGSELRNLRIANQSTWLKEILFCFPLKKYALLIVFLRRGNLWMRIRFLDSQKFPITAEKCQEIISITENMIKIFANSQQGSRQ